MTLHHKSQHHVFAVCQGFEEALAEVASETNSWLILEWVPLKHAVLTLRGILVCYSVHLLPLISNPMRPWAIAGVSRQPLGLVTTHTEAGGEPCIVLWC